MVSEERSIDDGSAAACVSMILQLSELNKARRAQAPPAVANADLAPDPQEEVEEKLRRAAVQLCCMGDLERLKKLVETHGDADGKLLRSCSVLARCHTSGVKEDAGIVFCGNDRFLVLRESQLTGPPKRSSCMQYAAVFGHAHVVHYLLEQGVEADHNGYVGDHRAKYTPWTPRTLAVCKHGQNSEVAKLLPVENKERSWRVIGTPESSRCTLCFHGELARSKHIVDDFYAGSPGDQRKFLHSVGYVSLPGEKTVDKRSGTVYHNYHTLYTPDGGRTFELRDAADKELFPGAGAPPVASALQYAAFSGSLDMVSYLIEHEQGVGPKYMAGRFDSCRWTPREIAERKQEEARQAGNKERAEEYGAVVERLCMAENRITAAADNRSV